jgi:hypothetical protein
MSGQLNERASEQESGQVNDRASGQEKGRANELLNEQFASYSGVHVKSFSLSTHVQVKSSACVSP